ncbi:hypothetical protein C9374_011978 [Naegleria lovaniensis]|uniref:Nodulin-like domain-containing protein n=1 Tax=Naegleria lovaniensis TaxID=51637 RepID=A0AA88GDY4_NAELO|nr:uncharacterized protein C9374_011978 [Naegleria lovaniensis]KAG2373689.1 hypothetical protein C9374_011978 [Naegleria lovaniensis]
MSSSSSLSTTSAEPIENSEERVDNHVDRILPPENSFHENNIGTQMTIDSSMPTTLCEITPSNITPIITDSSLPENNHSSHPPQVQESQHKIIIRGFSNNDEHDTFTKENHSKTAPLENDDHFHHEMIHEKNHFSSPNPQQVSKFEKFSKLISILNFLLFGNRWISFLIGALLTFLSGTHYAYSSISPTIKNDLNFSQTQVNLIGTAANVGTYFALPVSMLNDFIGSRVTCVISGLLLFSGYFTFYLVYIKAIPLNGSDAYIFIACFMAVMGQGSAGAYAAAITTNIKNFEEKHRGKIIGFMGSCVALSSAVFSLIYSVGFERKLGEYLLFVGVFGGGVTTVLGTLFMNQIGIKKNEENSKNGNVQDHNAWMLIDEEEDVQSFVHDEDLEDGDVEQINDFLMMGNDKMTEKNDKKEEISQEEKMKEESEQITPTQPQELIMNVTSQPMLSQSDLMTSDILEEQDQLEEREEEIQVEIEQVKSIEDEMLKSTEHHEHPLLLPKMEKKLESKFDKIYSIAQKPIPNANPIQMLFSLDFYLTFFVYFACMGSGLVIVNNLGSIVISYGGYDGQQHVMVIIFACSNALGRLLFGLTSDSFSRYVTRTTFLTGASILMLICQLVVLVSPLWMFYLILILLGNSFGGVAVMIPSFLSERFGPKYFAVNSSICSLASSLGSFLLATLVAGKVYESNIASDNLSKICYGNSCFQATFYLTTLLCSVSCVACIVLMYRTRGLYQILYYRKVLNLNHDPVMTK